MLQIESMSFFLCVRFFSQDETDNNGEKNKVEIKQWRCFVDKKKQGEHQLSLLNSGVTDFLRHIDVNH